MLKHAALVVGQPLRAIWELFTATPRSVDCGAAPVISLKVCRYGFNSVDCARRAPAGGTSNLEPFAQLGLWSERCAGISLDDRIDTDDLRANSSRILTGNVYVSHFRYSMNLIIA